MMKKLIVGGFILTVAALASGCSSDGDIRRHRHPARVEDPYRTPPATPVRDGIEDAHRRGEQRREQRRKAFEPLRPEPDCRLIGD